MPMTLITATPGSGKTLYALTLIYKYLNEGRNVYTNILGIDIDGVRTFDMTSPKIHDWRDLPNGSVVVYDEAHEHPAFSSEILIQDRKELKRHQMDIGDSLSLHRHFGFDFVFISQAANQIDSRLYQFFGRHIHLVRPFGFKNATIYEWFHVKTAPNTATARNESKHTRQFKYPKYLYGKYKSTEQDTVKSNFPAKYMALIGLFFLFVLYMIPRGVDLYDSYAHPENRKKHTEPAVESPVQQTSVVSEPVIHDPVKTERYRVAATFASGSSCRAYNSVGERLNFITDDECLAYSNHEVRFKAAAVEVVNDRLQAVNYRSSTGGMSGDSASSQVIQGKYIQ